MIIDLMLKAASLDDIIAWGVAGGFISAEEGPDGTTTYIPASGGVWDVIGAVVVTPAVLDDQGNVTAPAVMDEAIHVNLRAADPLASAQMAGIDQTGIVNRPGGLDLAGYAVGQQFKSQGTRKVERADVYYVGAVGLIDPATVKTPIRIWQR